MAGGSRAPRRRVKMRLRISAGKLNLGDARKLNHGDAGKLNPDDAGEVDRAVDVVKRPIRHGGLRIDIHGDLYVPDSEEEESDMHMEPDSRPCQIRRAEVRPFQIRLRRRRLRVDANGVLYVPDLEDEDSGTVVEVSSTEATADLPTGMHVQDTDTAADGVELAAMGSLGVDQVAAKKAAQIVAAMKLTPEVQARLEAVLANLDPLFHDEFVNMYKILQFHLRPVEHLWLDGCRHCPLRPCKCHTCAFPPPWPQRRNDWLQSKSQWNLTSNKLILLRCPLI